MIKIQLLLALVGNQVWAADSYSQPGETIKPKTPEGIRVSTPESTGKVSGASFKGLQACFTPKSSGNLVETASSWNTYPKPVQVAGLVTPNSQEEVAEIVKCARKMNTTVSVKSGGHSYEAYWVGNQNGIAIDLKNINQITFPGNKRIKVGAGSLLGPVTAALIKKSQQDKSQFTYALPHGLQEVVGVGGHTLGGGFGLLSRNKKILVDTVKEITMINYEGKKIIANEKENPELFTALRGAGAGSFGVITFIEYEYVEVPKELTVARFNWTATTKTDFTKIWDTIMNYYDNQNDNGVTHYANFKPGGIIELGATLSHSDPKQQKECLNKMIESLKPQNKISETRDFLGAYGFFAGMAGAEKPLKITDLENTPISTEKGYYKGRSGYFAKAFKNSDVTDKLGDMLIKQPKAGFFLLIDLWRGEILKEDCNAPTSFIHRNIFASAQIGTFLEDEASIKFGQDVYDLFKPHFPQAYQNYIDRNEKPSFMTTYYGHMAKYLVEVKNKWDPTNMFKFELSIPLKLTPEEEANWKKFVPTSLTECCQSYTETQLKCRSPYPSNKDKSYCNHPGFKSLPSKQSKLESNTSQDKKLTEPEPVNSPDNLSPEKINPPSDQLDEPTSKKTSKSATQVDTSNGIKPPTKLEDSAADPSKLTPPTDKPEKKLSESEPIIPADKPVPGKSTTSNQIPTPPSTNPDDYLPNL